MVTMLLSAVSVIVSIFCVRVNSITSPLPPFIRTVAFGFFARIMCVSTPDKPEPTVVLDASPDAAANSTARVYYVPADRTSTVRSTASVPGKRPHLAVSATSGHAGSGHMEFYRLSSPHESCYCQCQLKTQVDKLLHELQKVLIFGLSSFCAAIVLSR